VPHGAGSAVDEPIVGIDLGTCHSSVAVVENGIARVIPNQEGSLSTPSVVARTDSGEWLVGEPARRQAVANPRRTIVSFKRLMGRVDSELGDVQRKAPFHPRLDAGDATGVILDGQFFYPAQLAALVLRKLKEAAEADLGRPVRRAVITVPAYFNESQRQATLDAARLAGFDTEWMFRDPANGKVRRVRMRIINEPTAAALTHTPGRGEQRLAVIHMGGGTFDVSMLDVGDGVYSVRSVHGDTRLGGDDFDEEIVNYLADRFLAAHKVDLRADFAALQRLREAAEQAKRDLSQLSQVEICLPYIAEGAAGPLHLEMTLNRPEFERLTARLVDRCRGLIVRALRDAKFNPSDVEAVLLVGGMMRVPSVCHAIREAFSGSGFVKVLPDDAVASGAAHQGAQFLLGSRSYILLVDVTPFSLGVETLDGQLACIIPGNTRIPTEKTHLVSTARDNQAEVVVRVFQGESALVNGPGSRKLGEVRLGGLRPAPKGEPQISVTLTLDINGILDVTARDMDTGRTETARMFVSGGLSAAKVEQLYREDEQERLIRNRFGGSSTK
jgi:molecular chaperone DnaK